MQVTENAAVATGKLIQCLVFLKIFIRPMDSVWVNSHEKEEFRGEMENCVLVDSTAHLS